MTPRIIIEIRGGCLWDVLSDSDVRVMVVDWDNISIDDDDIGIDEFRPDKPPEFNKIWSELLEDDINTLAYGIKGGQ